MNRCRCCCKTNLLIIFVIICCCIQSYGFVSKFHLPTTNGKLRRFEKPETYDFNEFEKDDRMNHPKLTRNEELLYGRIINLAQGIEERRLQLQKLFNRDNISDEEVAHDLGLSTEKLVSLKHQGNIAEMTLVRCHFRLVKNVAEMILGSSDSFGAKELVVAGYEGLKTAIRRFDPELKFRLATSAAWWIRDAMNKYLAAMEGLDLNSFHIWRKIVAYENEFRSNFGRMPPDETIASVLNVSVEKVAEIRAKKRRETYVDFNQKIDKHSDNSRTLGDVVFNRNENGGDGD